jgi:hypothetical protein
MPSRRMSSCSRNGSRKIECAKLTVQKNYTPTVTKCAKSLGIRKLILRNYALNIL